MGNLVINKGKVNNLVMTLSERSRISNPAFLVVIKSKFNGKETKFSAMDIAPTNNRYNILEVTEKTSPNNMLSEVELVTGEHDYWVYESLYPTLDVNDTTGEVLQRGFIIVKK